MQINLPIGPQISWCDWFYNW